MAGASRPGQAAPLARAVHLIEQGRPDDALPLLGEAFARDPAALEPVELMGKAHHRAGRPAEALAAFRCALAADPTPLRRALAAGALLDLNRLDEALEEARLAAEAAPENAACLTMLGASLRAKGDPAAALEPLAAAVALEPRLAPAQVNLGHALLELGRLEEAEAAFRAALSADPSLDKAAANLGVILLTMGRFDEGWRHYLRRPFQRDEALPAKPLPASLAGRRFLLEGEQGLGDELFFLRWAPALAARGAVLCYRPSPKLASLAARLPFIRQVLRPGERSKDKALPLGDLPWLLQEFGTPPPVPLAPLPELVEKLAADLARFGPPPYVGVTWRAGVQAYNKLSKQVPLAVVAAALTGMAGSLVMLQRNPRDGEKQELERLTGRPVLDASAINEDMEAMLALLSLLDSQVAVSNTNIHLAAGLAKPALVLVPDPPEFRWGTEGERSPWFPSMTVLRLGSGNRAEAIQRAKALLEDDRPAEALAELRANPGRASLVEGSALLMLGRAAEARDNFAAIAAAEPRNAEAWNNLAQAHWRLAEVAEAEEAWTKALAIAPDFRAARANLSLLHLAEGRFAEGWDNARHRAVANRPGPPVRKLPPDLAGHNLFLEGEQGLGDEIFLLRFAVPLAERGARLAFRPNAKIAPLLRGLPFLAHIAGPGDEPRGDARIWLGDLPWLLDAHEPLPSITLSPDPAKLKDCLASLEGRPRPWIGVTWRAGLPGFNSLHKELPLEALAEALRPAGGTVFALQRQPAEGEVDRLSALLGSPVLNAAPLNEDLHSMLPLLAVLDEVVGVSNTNVHLRAALGGGARVLLPQPPEFRWMSRGDTSPWFPAMRLYRQGVDGGWNEALGRLATDLSR